MNESKKTDLIDSILHCNVKGNIVTLPERNEYTLENYPEVKRTLLNAGARYSKNSFIFPSDAQPFIDRIVNGDKPNIKKEFQMFETPNNIGEIMLDLAEIKKGQRILEPSAGKGALIRMIQERLPHHFVYAYELMKENREILAKMSNTILFQEPDFLSAKPDADLFDRIIAYPPFRNNQDISHFMHMLDFLEPGGIVVSIMSLHWLTSENSREKKFREFLTDNHVYQHFLPKGSFKSSGTNIPAIIIKLKKNKSNEFIQF